MAATLQGREVMTTKEMMGSANERTDRRTDMNRLQLTFRELPTYSLAAQQNAYNLFSNLRLTYLKDEEDEDVSPVLRNVSVRLQCEGEYLLTESWEISQIAPGQHISLQDRTLQFSHDFLLNLSDEISIRFDFVVVAEGSEEPVLVLSESLNVLPVNFWGGEARQPELLAAFVKPNGPYVESLVKQVTEVLEANGHDRSADGYQSNSRERPYLMAAALWGVIAAQKISYVSPPPSYAHQGQLVRLASEISHQKMGACLDLSLLFASCLELMGLNTVIALTDTHAFVGVWLIDSMFPLLTNDDPMELRKRSDSRDLVLFESTMITNVSGPTFKQACDHARSLISEDSEEQFVYAIDIAQARSRRIKPLGTVEDRPEEVGADGEGAIMLPTIPPLPPVRPDERTIEDTPETRIDTWQRKLLDLTKRNPLLSFKERTAGVRIFCPDIGQMEDYLAEGTTFNFVSAEASPINDRERSAESFRLATGSDLHERYALDQLGKKSLVANMAKKKLENTLVSLLRKSKNDLEEGGANTLFLALGMLSWRETPEDTKTYKAPLILIPVELTRRSARAPVKIKQLVDEEPLFNLTLIEFLNNEHSINLNHFRENLPEDNSGLDVAAIWQDVRDAVSEQPGFEVVEECVVASFSFAKYLMWKDLHDRIDDLKANPFVEHLVEHPQDGYDQNASFLSQDEVDKKIDPTDIFIPLNADSSQIVAIDASSRPQDFVLEGPPGTGKSETIANMIANNLAKGRRVLFVAEKIAALQVVYRRLEKIGLDHLALELHSNKANKKAVLDQLRRASELREEKTSDDWIKTANLLRERRDGLNTFVAELHQTSDFGVSPRQAMSWVAGHAKGQTVKFDWGLSLSDCPVSDKAGLDSILSAAKDAGIAFSDVASLDPGAFKPVSALSWSYSWQARFVEVARSFTDMAEQLSEVGINLAGFFNLSKVSITPRSIPQLSALSELISLANEQSIEFAFGSDVGNRMDRLGQLASQKMVLDDKLRTIATGASAPLLADTPIDEWITLLEEAQQSWFKKLFIKGKLNKLARSAGYQKFSELDILYSLRDAKEIVTSVGKLADEFTTLNIWSGWDIEPQILVDKQANGRRIHELLRTAMGLADDPMDLLAGVKTKLVDGREFLEASKLMGSKIAFDKVRDDFSRLEPQLIEAGIELIETMPLQDLRASLQTVLENETKLKPWVEWTASKKELARLSIEPLAIALEAGAIAPSDAREHAYTAFCSWLAPRLIDGRPTLRQFKTTEHEQKLIEFRQLDEEVAKTTSGYITALLAQKTPDIKSKEQAPHFRTLSRELQKKTRHKPVRVLFEDMGERLLDLTPCLMMSPLSVAQFLPSDFNAFDVVIFDEASQMTTWDSVGAIARGKNVIVVGDPKQMPPTNFFSSSVDPDDPDEDDMESILDQALAAGLPHRRLMGHYRSRHETLIAFSNSKYYDNALVTYPSSDTKESAVTLQRVEGVYAKGTGRNNPIEARAVVKEVVRRLKHSKLGQLSLGIVTLNTEQQRTIEDLLDDARRRYPEIEEHFVATDEHDPVFVKNLESVQGDERDVIIFSLAYGPTEPNGKTMSMNFGPLNKQGGERRLNVAITRATTEVIVFSSFDSSMIDLSRTSSTAVEHLKHYLEFAERGPTALAEQATAAYGVDQFDSDFEQAVAWALRDLGWQVQTQIGVSKFRVDLGVVHPDLPGIYLAGVECDGATYHSSPSARDRDRTRHAILENLGWRLTRLWSTDYFRDPQAAIQNVHNRLTEILAEDRAYRESTADTPGTDCDEVDIDDIDLDSPIAEPSPASIEEEQELTKDDAEFPASAYDEPSHRPQLEAMAREILEKKPGITLKALTLEIANRHGLKRTSSKQLDTIEGITEGWAGVLRLEGEAPVYWSSPEEIVDLIPWRGLNAFGDEREWSELAYPEALGLACEALEKQPSDPVDYICNVFELRRRHSTTLATFNSWVESARLIAR